MVWGECTPLCHLPFISLQYMYRPPYTNAHKLTTVTNMLLREFLATAVLYFVRIIITVFTNVASKSQVTNSISTSGKWLIPKTWVRLLRSYCVNYYLSLIHI